MKKLTKKLLADYEEYTELHDFLSTHGSDKFIKFFTSIDFTNINFLYNQGTDGNTSSILEEFDTMLREYSNYHFEGGYDNCFNDKV